MNTIAPQDVIQKEEIDLLFQKIESTTKQIQSLKLEQLENQTIMEKVWNDAVMRKQIEPGKNPETRKAQMADLSRLESEELERINEELTALEGELDLLKIRKERINYLLRWCGVS